MNNYFEKSIVFWLESGPSFHYLFFHFTLPVNQQNYEYSSFNTLAAMMSHTLYEYTAVRPITKLLYIYCTSWDLFATFFKVSTQIHNNDNVVPFYKESFMVT